MFQATRRRLALWYTAVTAVLLLLFASGVYFYVRNTLIERIDDTLNHVVEVVERSLVIESVNSGTETLRINLEASFRDNTDTVEDDHIDLEWFSANGELLWSTLSTPLNIPIHANRTGETVRVGNEGWQKSPVLLRQVTHRVEFGRQVLGYLRVSHPWFEVSKPSRQFMLDLAIGTWLMVLSVGASGWFLSGKAMEPVGDSYQRLKQFTADASHELRSPITLIQTNVQVALADLESAEVEPTTSLQYRQQLKLVERLTQRLGRLVNDLLFLARQDSGISKDNFSSCPLDALLMEVLEEQQLLAKEKKISLALDLVDPADGDTNPELSDNWFTLVGNWDQLVRLFTNLIGNAVQYTPSSGRVNVELARLEGMNRVAGLRYSSAQLQVKVSDTGVGIPGDALPKLFDRFYRVDPARTHSNGNTATDISTGSGLGLAIAQAIVEHHQGQIQVESRLGKGTTFIVTLPVTLES
ncbi:MULTISPECIES: sensor histidine kinase [unclassified Tolypothrix]|uniref:sensor histidine kinase n=1 Tax=unclassified Tolypothrix TaxID=2649714 RepID=UPI0005EAB0BB|nr:MULTISPECIES: HAMP domain-containing sensor histidine kinase [unclassified Tolypothrix]BAY91972.1 integral membrane sensor signal transduction histidine kinase [Microchaete diplosiphon NIES-3275]EKF04845.1 sensor histidine kinase [Tolypothrix sp. PCC 7601]MBE9083793.1 two-component sensor histidine kinase [Tolypothrix sp. LEGE 11397]UYD25967.1 two-component sensor histidine kinase [Tolypothrix sp. PCC 7712]UYD31795.1 two-component sensor histidine kinase [Tolypothrix sp. PCC 7601]